MLQRSLLCRVRAPAAAPHRRSRHFASVDLGHVRQDRPRTLRSQQPGYVPLSTRHPAFGLKQTAVQPSGSPYTGPPRPLLSTDHPAFGTRNVLASPDVFLGPVGVSGFFFSMDPSFAVGRQYTLNPNAQLTIRDQDGNMARARYRCYIHANGGFKVEALVRTQVGWISPKVTFSRVPHVIHLGKGVEITIPYMAHFLMVCVLDEHGDNTGSFLYFSGTPLLGFGAGFSRITGGRMLLSPTRQVNPLAEESHFIGHVHRRQLGFVVLKALGYVVCLLACIPATQKLLQYLPDPFHRHSESDV